MNGIVAQRYMREMHSSSGGTTTTSVQALRSGTSRNHFILRSIDANSHPSYAQLSNTSSPGPTSIIKSGNDRGPVMCTYDLLPKASLETSASGLSKDEADQSLMFIGPAHSHPLFLPTAMSKQAPLEPQDARAISTRFATTFTNDGDSPESGLSNAHMALDSSVSEPHLGTTLLSPVTQMRSHHQVSPTSSSAEQFSIEPITPSPGSLDTDDATSDSLIVPTMAVVVNSGASSAAHQVDDNQSLRSHHMLSLRNGKKLVAATSIRRSSRVHREDYLPLGPRHLELEYHEAWEELRYVTIKTVFDLGYDSKKIKAGRPVRRTAPPTVQDIMQMNIPSVMQARRRVDEADRRLNDALAKGFTWDNTPPPKYEITEDKKGNILEVVLIEDPLAGDRRQLGKRGNKRQHEQDANIEQDGKDPAKRRCTRTSST